MQHADNHRKNFQRLRFWAQKKNILFLVSVFFCFLTYSSYIPQEIPSFSPQEAGLDDRDFSVDASLDDAGFAQPHYEHLIHREINQSSSRSAPSSSQYAYTPPRREASFPSSGREIGKSVQHPLVYTVGLSSSQAPIALTTNPQLREAPSHLRIINSSSLPPVPSNPLSSQEPEKNNIAFSPPSATPQPSLTSSSLFSDPEGKTIGIGTNPKLPTTPPVMQVKTYGGFDGSAGQKMGSVGFGLAF